MIRVVHEIERHAGRFPPDFALFDFSFAYCDGASMLGRFIAAVAAVAALDADGREAAAVLFPSGSDDEKGEPSAYSLQLMRDSRNVVYVVVDYVSSTGRGFEACYVVENNAVSALWVRLGGRGASC